MEQTQEDTLIEVISMSDRESPRIIARKRIADYLKPVVCNQHSSESPAPTLDVDRILDDSFLKIEGK